MMRAAIDTCLFAFLFDDSTPTTADDYGKRWQAVRDTMRRQTDAGTSFVVPAPVLAELASGRDGISEYRRAIDEWQKAGGLGAIQHASIRMSYPERNRRKRARRAARGKS